MPEPTGGFRQRDACALCGSRTFEERGSLEYAPEDARGFLPPDAIADAFAIGFRLRRCPAGIYQGTTPQPTSPALSRLYAATGSDYFEPLAEASPDRRRLYGAVRSRLNHLGVTGGRLLDLGCGTGQALREFRGTFELF